MQATTISDNPYFALECEPHPRYVRCRHSCLPVSATGAGHPSSSIGRVPRFSSRTARPTVV